MRATGWMRGLLVLSFGGVLMAGSVMALLLSEVAGAETQETGTSLSNPTTRTTQADLATKITPEQEAALVEVRKILREAWDVVNSIVPPRKLPGTTTPEASKTDLERYKERLLKEIEEARFRAGDFTTTSTTKQHLDLALTQLRYGHLQEAVRTATEERLSFTSEALVVMKMLTDVGDFAGAMAVAQAQAKKRSLEIERQQVQAELLAYLARRQTQLGKQEASV